MRALLPLAFVTAVTSTACGRAVVSGPTALAPPTAARADASDLGPARGDADVRGDDAPLDAPESGDARDGAPDAIVGDATDAPGDAATDAPGDAATDAPGDAATDAHDGPLPYGALAVVTGAIHTCVILDDHQVKCWGDNSYGQLGYGDTRSRGGATTDMGDALPLVDLGSGRTATALAASHYSTCAILDDGNVKCWGLGGLTGQGAKGNIGDAPGEMGDHLPPLYFGGRRAVYVGVGYEVACASMDDDTIWCWGSTTPQPLALGPNPRQVKELAADGNAVMALYTDGTVVSVDPPAVEQVAFGGTPITVGGSYATRPCAILSDGSTVCLSSGSTPDTVAFPTDVVALGVQLFSGLCALRANGAVQCAAAANLCQASGTSPYWCADDLGTIALGQPAVSITNNGSDFACSLLADGTVKCWGNDPSMTPPSWLGAGVEFAPKDGGVTYGAWHAVDLGTHP
jgi:hypothetical protein